VYNRQPICMPPVGAFINGLGALPSQYGHTLRGAHNALRASKNKKVSYDHHEVEVNQINRAEIPAHMGWAIMAKTCANQVNMYAYAPSPTPSPAGEIRQIN
jgi:hypothetical protein